MFCGVDLSPAIPALRTSVDLVGPIGIPGEPGSHRPTFTNLPTTGGRGIRLERISCYDLDNIYNPILC